MGRYRPSEFLKFITGDPNFSVTNLSTYVLTNWTNVNAWTFWGMCDYFGLPRDIDSLRWVIENVMLPLNYRFILFHQWLTINWSNQHNPGQPNPAIHDICEEYDMPVVHRFVKGTWGRDEHYEDEYVAQETSIDPRIVTVNGGKPPSWSDPRFPSPFPINTFGRNFCVSADTEILTFDGWKTYDELLAGTPILTMNLKSGKMEYMPLAYLNVFKHHGKIVHVKNRTLDAFFTPEHRVLLKKKYSYKKGQKYVHRETPLHYRFAKELRGQLEIPAAGEFTGTEVPYPDEFIALIGWIIGEGRRNSADCSGISIYQSLKNEANVKEIRKLLSSLKFKFTEKEFHRKRNNTTKYHYKNLNNNYVRFYIHAESAQTIWTLMKGNLKRIPRILLNSSSKQRKILYDALMRADGTLLSNGIRFYPGHDQKLADDFQELCIKSDLRSLCHNNGHNNQLVVYLSNRQTHYIEKGNISYPDYEGVVWCPTVKNGNFVARRNGSVFITGNCQHGYAIEMPVGHDAPIEQQTDFERHYYPIMIEGYPSPCSDIHPHYLEKMKRDYTYLASAYGLAARPSFIGAWTSVDVPDAPSYHLSVNYSLFNMEYYTQSQHFANETVGGIHIKDGSPCLLYETFVSKTRSLTGESTTDIPPLYQDIVDHHYDMGWNPTWGWSRWIQEKIAETMGDFAEWFQTVSPYAPRRFHWYNEFILDDVIRRNPKTDAITFQHQSGFVGSLTQSPSQDDPNWVEMDCEEKLQWILNRGGYGVVPHSTLGAPGSGGGPQCAGAPNNTGWIQPEEIKREYLVTIPMLARGVMGMDYQPCRICDFTWQTWSRYFGRILAKMRYYGGWFGQEKEATRVLLFGKSSNARVFPQFFTHAIDITWGLTEAKFTADPDLTIYGDLAEFDAVVSFGGGASNVSSSLQQRIRDFVYNGGGLVVGSIPAWGSDMFDNAAPINISHSIFKPFTDMQDYGQTIRVGTYGTGTVVHIPFPAGQIGLPSDSYAQYLGGTPRDSFITLLTNAVMYAADPARTDFPVMFVGLDTIFRRAPTEFKDRTRFSVCGRPGNILVWISNDGNTVSTVNLNLNTNFYGLPDSFVAINVDTFDMVKGSAVVIEGVSFIQIEVGVAPGGWAPVYICPLLLDKHDVYCNAFVVGRSVGVNAEFTVRAAHKLPVYLAVNSEVKPNAVIVGVVALPEMPLELLNTPETENGFFYDVANGLVLIKYLASSQETVTILYEEVPTHMLSVESSPFEGVPFTVE